MIEGFDFNPDYRIYDSDQSQSLRRRITHEFISFVKVDNVLSLFISANHVTKVLTDDDVDKIKTANQNSGSRAGADKLLECLALYLPDWFSVLQGVLRHLDVKQDNLAKSFDEHFKNVFTSEVVQTVSIQRPPIVIADSTSSQGHGHADTRDDFNLDDDEAISEAEAEGDGPDCTLSDTSKPRSVEESLNPGNCISDMPKSQSLDKSKAERIQSRPLPDPKDVEETLVKCTEQLNLQPIPNPAAPTQEKVESSPYDEGYTQVEGTQVSSMGSESMGSEYDEVMEQGGATAAACSAKPDRGPSETACGYENVSDLPAPERRHSRPTHASNPRAFESKRQPINEFSFAETEKALCGYDGWHTNQSDRNVIYTFRDILEEKKDGHYLMWFWGKKKRPAICVSFGGELITFVIHRRRNRNYDRTDCWSSDSMHIFYIDKSFPKPTLKELFEYHKKNGLVNMKEGPTAGQTIQLKYPISPIRLH